MQYTTNLNLNKPGSSDQYNIQHFNDNFDTLDSHVHALEESADSIELELTEKINEAEQFPNMTGVCPINKGGTGANNAQNALVNLHGSVPVVSEIPSTAEVTFMDRTPADVELGTPEVLDVKGITLDRLADAVYERIRTGGLFTNAKNGLVPKTGASTGVRFLSSEGIWRTPDGASTVYEATASSSWAVNGDTILRIKGDCTSVINDASVFGTRLTIINETESAQTVAMLTAKGSETLSIPAGDMKQYIWVNYWREQEFGGGDTYSTIETKVGTWIDGKPIYRKTFKGTAPLTTQGQPGKRTIYKLVLDETTLYSEIITAQGWVDWTRFYGTANQDTFRVSINFTNVSVNLEAQSGCNVIIVQHASPASISQVDGALYVGYSVIAESHNAPTMPYCFTIEYTKR